MTKTEVGMATKSDDMTSGPARLFGVDVPATGEDAQFTISGSQFAVRTASQTVTSPLVALRVREIGTGRMGLELAWDTPEGVRAAQVFDPTALSELRADTQLQALPQMTIFHAGQRRRSVGRSLGWAALVVFLLLPLLLILLFVGQADRVARFAASRVTIEQETSLGDQAFAAMRDSLKLEDGGPEYEAVQSIGRRLTRDSKYRYRFHIANDDAINAFAIPGGIIVVHTGLITATRRPEELAGVLAHEVQHVEQRHSLQAVIKDLGLRGLWLLASGDIGSGVVGQATLELTSLSFSRDAEAQADAKGFDALIAAGIDPSGMADFFATMGKQEGAMAPPPFMSTHPASDDREGEMRAREASVKGRTFVALNLGAWPPTVPE
jgi:Zn-dependent protease with chaperone function